jgi:2-polyprenyl-3-methyl-5-hydroxy-6-metoxy-1,4-benzoquinol methylase
MDLRQFSPRVDQVARAKELTVKGLLAYQPLLFSDEFEVGVGYEFAVNKWAGLAYYPDIDRKLVDASPQLARIIVDPEMKEPFRHGNADLRLLYDFLGKTLADSVGGAPGASFLDVGCNTGYFPITFARMGADRSIGCDREDFSPAFQLLNEIIGTKATFTQSRYDVKERTIAGVPKVDAVLSVMMLCHVSSPLSYLAALGSLAKKSLLVLTIVNSDTHLSVSYGEPRGDYAEDVFPNCFDNLVCPSRLMLRRSFELMGFSKVAELDLTASGAPSMSWRGYPFCAFLGQR